MRARPIAMFVFALTLGGCESGMHDMYDQPKYKPLAPSALFADGNSSRTPPLDTQARTAGAAADASAGRRGAIAVDPSSGPALPLDANGKPIVQDDAMAPGYANPLPLTPTLLARGRERFDIYCAPCHGRVGDGNGMIAERGFPHPPSFHDERLRRAPDSHFYQVITQGYGAMFPYAARIDAADRWAIVAYVRALQLSQHAARGVLDARDLDALRVTAAAPSSGVATPKESH